MRKHIILLILLLMSWQVTAQDSATCEVTVQQAFAAVRTTCADVDSNKICYASGEVEAVPRYLTSDFSFDDPGTLLDISRIESVTTQPLDVANGNYGVAYMQLSAGLPEDSGITLMSFGNTYIANNALPVLDLQITVNTLVNVQSEPTDLSESIGILTPNETIIANGRAGDPLVADNAWIRVKTVNGNGWLKAFTVNEDYLIPSLTLVDPNERVFEPLQAMTFISGVNDRGCNNATDSGLIIQSVLRPTTLQINKVDIGVEPNTTLFVQAQSNSTLDIYVLEGDVAVSVNVADVAQLAQAGQVISVPLGLDSLVSGVPMAATPYLNAKVASLATAMLNLPRTSAIAEGTDTPVTTTASSSEVIAIGEEVAAAPDVSSEVVMAPSIVDEVAVVPAEAVAAVPAEEVALTPAEEVVAAPVVITGSGATSDFANQIRSRGTIRVGVNGSLPTFSLETDGSYSGFEIDLAKEVVLRLFGSDVQIEFVKVSARQRPNILAEGNADLMIRNSDFTPEREAWGVWTNSFYFIDGQRLLVRADSDINDIGDLSGRIVAVQVGTPQETTINELAEENGFSVSAVGGILTELIGQLDSGQVDAITGDWTALEALRTSVDNPDNYKIVGNPVTNIPWNAIVPPGQTGFRDDVDAALLAIINDGTWQIIYGRWFGENIPDVIEVIFAPGASTGVVEDVIAAPAEAVVAVPADETAAPPVDDVAVAPPAVAETSSSDLIPVSGDISVTIFTVENQQRMIRVTPSNDESFQLELIRNGEVVYDARYQYYESSGRWENVRNSFEYIDFSDTAGQEELGCNREPDISGFFNGAQFEGRKGC